MPKFLSRSEDKIRKHSFIQSFIGLTAFVLILCFLPGCQQQIIKRPFGFIFLGKIEELNRAISFMTDKGLLLRKDADGFYVMSILCTHDLAPLELKQVGEQQILASRYTESSYNLEGEVLTGPAKGNLPYYEIVAAASLIDGPVDSLYVKIGTEKPKTWRFKVPGM